MFGSNAVAVDIGTARTRVFAGGCGRVADEPTAATNLVLRGTLADVNMAARFLSRIIDKHCPRSIRGIARILFARPACVTSVERQALIELGKRLGAAEVGLVAAPIAAAIGTGVAVESPRAQLVLDVGAGKSEAAIVSMNSLIASASTDVGGNTMTASIQEYMRTTHGVPINRAEAEDLKHRLGSATAFPLGDWRVGGATVACQEIQDVLLRPLEKIAEMLRSTMMELAPEVCEDLFATGILVVGGGAHMNQLQAFLEARTGLPVHIPPEPEACAIHGLARLIHFEPHRSGRTAA